MAIRLDNPRMMNAISRLQKYSRNSALPVDIQNPGYGIIRTSVPIAVCADSLYFLFPSDIHANGLNDRKEFREFFLKICQMILLNLLLPILTATVGYGLGKDSQEP